MPDHHPLMATEMMATEMVITGLNKQEAVMGLSLIDDQLTASVPMYITVYYVYYFFFWLCFSPHNLYVQRASCPMSMLFNYHVNYTILKDGLRSSLI